MLKYPLVSVIVTTKNEEKNIGRLLKSLKKQAYPSIEIIVVDNNSTDKTAEIAKKFTKKVFNKGPERSVQRNFGAKKSTGKYLLFLDADMELSSRVVESSIETVSKSKHKALIIPEKTTGKGFVAAVRKFEREMYMGDVTIEVARFFEKRTFREFGGYDPELTGPEDYDLPYRISKKHSIGWAKEYLLHHEESLTLGTLLKKRFYYASRGAKYAEKHPELIAKQGTILFRRAYTRNWKKFIREPFLGLSFIGVRVLETAWAVAGYIKAVGFIKFFETLTLLLRRKD